MVTLTSQREVFLPGRGRCKVVLLSVGSARESVAVGDQIRIDGEHVKVRALEAFRPCINRACDCEQCRTIGIIVKAVDV